MEGKRISMAVIRRMPRYYRYVDELYQNGTARISSGALAAKMGLTASQVRQDFNCFGGFGQQGYGYNVENLRASIREILKLDCSHKAIIIGVGNLGRALMTNFNFGQSGFALAAAFDVKKSCKAYKWQVCLCCPWNRCRTMWSTNGRISPY